jgi:hypothetical protein
MALKATSSNGVKVYNVTAGKSTPQWYDDVAKKKVKGQQPNSRGQSAARYWAVLDARMHAASMRRRAGHCATVPIARTHG